MTDRQDRWTPAFLAALRVHGVISWAAKEAGIDRSAVTRRRQTDAEFAAAVEATLEDSTDDLEAEARKRAVAGVEEPVVHQGRLVYRHKRTVDADGVEHYEVVLDDMGQPVPLTIRKPSDYLMGLLLKGLRKKFSTERTEITGAEGGPVAIDETKRAARAAALLEIARQRKQAEDEFG